MAEDHWPTKPLFVNSLHLDPKNPRLGRESLSRAPREIIQYLFEHDKALEIADSISTRGYFYDVSSLRTCSFRCPVKM